MDPQDQIVVTDRLRRALVAFRTAESLLLVAHRRLKAVPQTEMDAFWDGPGRRIEANVQATATALIVAFKAFSAAGLVAGAVDRHLVTQAQRCLAEGPA